jgi:UDP-glucuronate 4-epimerase
MFRILVTGAAGFIGFHTSKALLDAGVYDVTGLDNLNDYYDQGLKQSRLEILRKYPNFSFKCINLINKPAIDALFRESKFDYVIHLAAQAGVRYSMQNPYAYLDSNLNGFLNILEACRNNPVKHLIFASSSSIYGANRKMPFSVHQNVDHPISLYAATKKSNELMAHTYSAVFNIPTTGLRFFTVYGPYGRPDMAMFLFTKAIIEGKPIDVYNNGNMKRDFTYIDDITESINRLIPKIPVPNPQWSAEEPDPSTSFAPYRLFNIGNHEPVLLGKFIELIEDAVGKKAVKKLLPLQEGDVLETYADIEELAKEISYRPKTPIEVGVREFVKWYREYYRV